MTVHTLNAGGAVAQTTGTRPKRVLVDLDSIVFDILGAWIGEANRRFGDNLTVADIVSWSWHELSRGGTGIYKILEEPGFFRNLRPYPGAVEGVRRLNERHRLKIVTAADHVPSYSEKAAAVREHMPFLNKRQLVVMHDKHEIKADYLVDDAPHNAEAYKLAHPDAKVIAIGYPYNVACPHIDVIAGDWRDPAAAWARIEEEIG